MTALRAATAASKHGVESPVRADHDGRLRATSAEAANINTVNLGSKRPCSVSESLSPDLHGRIDVLGPLRTFGRC